MNRKKELFICVSGDLVAKHFFFPQESGTFTRNQALRYPIAQCHTHCNFSEAVSHSVITNSAPFHFQKYTALDDTFYDHLTCVRTS